jgi:hypothetical protein
MTSTHLSDLAAAGNQSWPRLTLGEIAAQLADLDDRVRYGTPEVWAADAPKFVDDIKTAIGQVEADPGIAGAMLGGIMVVPIRNPECLPQGVVALLVYRVDGAVTKIVALRGDQDEGGSTDVIRS